MSGFLQVMVGSLPVNRIDHHLTGSDLLDCFQPREHKLIGCIIHIFPKVTTFQKHSLNNTISFEFFHLFDDLPYGIFPVGTIQEMNVFFVHRIQLQDIIIYLVQCIEYCRTVNEGRIAQYTYFCIREIVVTKCQCIFYNFRKMRVGSRFTVSGKCEYIGGGTVLLHIFQLFFQGDAHFFTSGQMLLRTMVGIEAAFTINAVERADFSVFRQ